MPETRIALSIVIYCLSVSAVPIWNKKLFIGRDLPKFPYPIATSVLQLAAVTIACALVDVATFACSRTARSWLFGPHAGYKLRRIAPVGLLFGFKFGITNWGLQLVPTSTHLLLQATDLLWTVAFARVLARERAGTTPLGGLAVLLSTAGSLLVAIDTSASLRAPLVPLLVNLLTPVVLSLCVVFLRAGTRELMREGNAVLGGPMSSWEFTAVKLALSTAVALALSLALESGLVDLSNGEAKAAWWVAFARYSRLGKAKIIGGGVFVAIFQVNLTWLTAMTSATTVGVVGGLKVVPQYALNALFDVELNLSAMKLGGATLVLAASMLYAHSRLAVSAAGGELENGSRETEERRALTTGGAATSYTSINAQHERPSVKSTRTRP